MPETTITLYVDPNMKGAGIRREDDSYAPGCWVATVAHRDEAVSAKGGLARVSTLCLTEAVTMTDAERLVRKHLGIGPRRKVAFEPTSPAQRAWKAEVRL